MAKAKPTTVPGYVLHLTEEEKACLAYVLNDDSTRAPLRFVGTLTSILQRFNAMPLVELQVEPVQNGDAREPAPGQHKAEPGGRKKKRTKRTQASGRA